MMGKSWHEVATVAEFESTDRKLVDLGGSTQIGIFKHNGGFVAISAWCSHQKASIMTGDVDDGEIMCPLHGARFKLNTGEALSLPATQPIPTYKLKIDGTKILVKA